MHHSQLLIFEQIFTSDNCTQDNVGVDVNMKNKYLFKENKSYYCMFLLLEGNPITSVLCFPGEQNKSTIMPLFCRYYSQKYPEMDDVVMVTVRSIAEMGAYVHLLEYNNIEGMILLSELSRRRIRSMNKLIRVGKTEPVVVIRVDKEKGKEEFVIVFK